MEDVEAWNNIRPHFHTFNSRVTWSSATRERNTGSRVRWPLRSYRSQRHRYRAATWSSPCAPVLVTGSQSANQPPLPAGTLSSILAEPFPLLIRDTRSHSKRLGGSTTHYPHFHLQRDRHTNQPARRVRELILGIQASWVLLPRHGSGVQPNSSSLDRKLSISRLRDARHPPQQEHLSEQKNSSLPLRARNWPPLPSRAA